MAVTLGEIAARLDGVLDGDASLAIERVRGFNRAGANEIAIVSDVRHYGEIDASGAALVVAQGCPSRRPNLIRVRDPRAALAPLMSMLAGPQTVLAGIDPEAHVAPSAKIGQRVFIAPGAVVCREASIGDDVQIHANAVVGASTLIGDGSVIHPNVTIYPKTRIGSRVVVHAGTVIGSDGFGYTANAEGMTKIPQLGIVEIGDDVEIGANCAIDRATLEVTQIRAGTKIDNLVQIGHNSEIGPRALLVAQVGVAGSVTIGEGAMLGGQAGISDHVTVGPGVMIGAQSGVHADIASGVWLGSPALPREHAGRVFAHLSHLPDYRDRVRALESKVEALEQLLARVLDDRPIESPRSS